MNKAIAVLTISIAGAASADIINVPGDFPTIQEAINAAMDGDEIVVAPGTYLERIDFLGKAVWLHSSDGPQVTVIDAQQKGRVVTCHSSEGPDTVLEGFIIAGGSSSFGGGMYNVSSSPTVINCTFDANTASSYGGGMYNTSSSSPLVVDCVFMDNTAFTGGGMYNVFSSHPTVIRCAFLHNMAHQSGGGMSNIGPGSPSSPTVLNCVFIGNTAPLVAGGMGSYGDPQVTNCLFIGNSSGRGGGYHGFVSNPEITNCTFAGNIASISGAAVFMSSGLATIRNSVFWGNSPDEIVDDPSNPSIVEYCDVLGGFPGIGNIDADPLFVDPDHGDYRLSPGSPCIDAGLNSAVPKDITTDLDGNPRFLEIPETPDCQQAPGTCGDLPVVDMGAYEALGGGCLAVTTQEIVCHPDGVAFTVNVEGISACTGDMTQLSFTGSGGAVGEEACFTVLVVSEGDFCCSTEICVIVPDCSAAAVHCDLDDDGLVGITDLISLLGTWGSCLDCIDCPADFDGDCAVGTTDLMSLLVCWD